MRNRGKLLTAILALVVLLSATLLPVAAIAETVQDKNQFDLDYLAKELSKFEPIKAYEEIEEPEKIFNDPDEEVRLIVSLKNAPTLSSSQEANVIAAQKSVQEKVLDITKTEEVFNEMGYLVNSFTVYGKKADIKAISALPEVESVEEALLFESDIYGSVKMIEADKVWQAPYNYKGEGTLISIIDTGVDVESPAMAVSDEEQAKLTKEEAEALIAEHNLPGIYISSKVPYGYDYADKDTDVKAGNKTSPHGMHVASIAAANYPNKNLYGMAPEAQILAMKVFSDSAAGAWSDDIAVAIKDSAKMGADVINMSLGSPGGFSSEDNSLARTISKVTDQGTIVVISAGNEGNAYDLNGRDRNILGTPDTGIVGSNSTHPDAISVASVESLYESCFGFKAKDNSDAIQFFGGATQKEPEGGRTYLDGEWVEVVHCNDEEGNLDIEDKDLSGKYALAMKEKTVYNNLLVEKVKAKGAIGIIIYSNLVGGKNVRPLTHVEEGGLSSFYIIHSDGMALAEMIENDGPVYLDMEKVLGPRPVADEIETSDFSSWGPSPELNFKPELAAPGGKILSLVNDGGLAYMGGTSMSAPHVSAVAALIVQAKPELRGRARVDYVKSVLMNTSEELQDHEHESLYSPRKVGSGMINVKSAIDTKVTATYKDTGKAAVELKNDIKPFTIELKNSSDEAKSFNVQPGTVYTGIYTDVNHIIPIDGATITASVDTIEVPAKGRAEVRFEIFVPTSHNRNYVEGFVTFEASEEDSEQPSLRVPYLGYKGDWSKDYPILDSPEGQPNPLFPESLHSTYLEMLPYGTEELWPFFATSLCGVSKYFSYVAPLGNSLRWVQGREDYNPDTVGINNEIAPDHPDYNLVNTETYPQVGALRGAVEVEAHITDAEGNVLRKLGSPNYIRKTPLARINKLRASAKILPEYGWDGTFYDSDSGEFVAAAEGQYNYRFRSRMGSEYDWQEINMPIKIDNTPPELPEPNNGDHDLFPVTGSGNNVNITYKGVTDSGVGVDNNIILGAWFSPEGLKPIPERLMTLRSIGDDGFKISLRALRKWVNVPDPVFVFGFMDYVGNISVRVCKIERENQIFLAKLVPAEDGYIAVPPEDKFIVYNKEDQAAGMTNEEVKVAALYSNDFASLTINEQEPDENGIFTFNVAEGETVSLKAKGVKENGKKKNVTYKLLYDVTEPYLEITSNIQENSQGIKYLQLSEHETSERIVGFCRENSSEKSKLHIVSGQMNETLTVMDTDQGSFRTRPFSVDYIPAQITPTDFAGNTGESFNFIVIKHDDDPENIPTPEDPDDDSPIPKVEITTAGFERLLDSGLVLYRGEESDSDTADITLEGTSNAVETIYFDNEAATMNSDGSWSIDLTLVQGVNHFAYHIVDAEGKIRDQTRVHIFFDQTLPNAVIETDPVAVAGEFILPDPEIYKGDGEELIILAPEEGLDVNVFGTITDTSIGYRLFINGDLVAEAEDITENEGEYLREPHPFSYLVHNMQDKDFIRVEYADVHGFGDDYIFTQKYQYLVDETAPTCEAFFIADGAEHELNDQASEHVSKNVKLGAYINDNLDPAPQIEIYVGNQKYEVEEVENDGDDKYVTLATLPLGIHSVRMVVKDSVGNQTDFISTVTIYDDPVIDVSAVASEIALEDAADFDPLENVTATDPLEGDITALVQVNPTNIEPLIPGQHRFDYSVSNSYGAEATAVAYVTVVGPPRIEGVEDEITIVEGEPFDPAAGVTAYDGYNNDITEDLIISGEYDTSVPGTYTIRYTVTDHLGQTVSETLTLIVEEEEEPTEPTEPEPTDPEPTEPEPTEPEPTEPEPTDPEPTEPEPTEPEPTEPEPTEPEPTDPEPTEPEPTEPEPTEPEPTEPEPTEPEPTEPEPTEPEPTEPEPTEPEPTEPEPTEPKPTEPEPTVPVPTKPEPTEPEPTEPEPTEPEPTEPEPTEPEPTVPVPTKPEPTEPEPTVPDPTEPEPTIPIVPTEPTEPIEPTVPTVPTGPSEPTIPTETVEPIIPIEPTDPTKPVEPVEPTEITDSTEAVEPTSKESPPKTGENISIYLIAVILVLATAALYFRRRIIEEEE